MKYRVVLHHSEEGDSVSALALPGCHSQGDTEGEALGHIADAIREYLASVEDERLDLDAGRVVEIEV